ncbi:MAG: hypothetical protein II220_00685 [Spirochaetales bacterium]|nr:hypothetical protein [Spirochaetales bacterium]
METKQIPIGNSREDVYTRRAIIFESLSPLIGMSIPCGAFSGKGVEILYKSVDETATRAAQRYESTLAAIRIVEAIEKSSFVKTDIPNAKQKKKMYFVKIYELKATLTDLGDVKIIVGERNNKRIIHYCITHKK